MSRGGGGGRAGRGHGKGSRTGRNLDKASRDNRSKQLNPENATYRSSRSDGQGPESQNSGGNWQEKMSRLAASRIQAHADKTGQNQDFKSRAQRAAEMDEDESNE
jgi:hypothetical protein